MYNPGPAVEVNEKILSYSFHGRNLRFTQELRKTGPYGRSQTRKAKVNLANLLAAEEICQSSRTVFDLRQLWHRTVIYIKGLGDSTQEPYIEPSSSSPAFEYPWECFAPHSTSV
jgi:hypothetical protein